MHIPWRGWKDILIRTYHEIQDDRLLSLAAGVVFYSLVALFPAIAAGVSVYALFSDAAIIAGHLSLLSDIVPAPRSIFCATEITRIATRSDGRLTLGFLLSFAIALWSANAGMKAIFDALNIIYDEEEKRGFVWLNLVSLFFTFCAIAGVLMAVGAVVVFPLILAAFGLTSRDAPLVADLRWPAMFVLIIVGSRRSLPLRSEPAHCKWRWLTVGSVFAAVTWLLVSFLFSWYLANFGNYNATYGALGAVVGLMMWMWLSTIVVLVGAELNSEIEHQTALRFHGRFGEAARRARRCHGGHRRRGQGGVVARAAAIISAIVPIRMLGLAGAFCRFWERIRCDGFLPRLPRSS